MKKIIFLIIDIILAYLIFVGVDAYRIYKDTFKVVKPLITIDEIKEDNKVTYKGLGYEVIYSFNKDERVVGADFYLLDRYLIWGYVE